jgi:hypothetical protein
MAAKIDGGDGFSCALTTYGDVHCWGTNNAGQLGNGSLGGSELLPAPVAGLGNASAIAANGWTACAVSGGRAYCWGSIPDSATPVQAPLSGVTDIAVSNDSICAVASRLIYCWGGIVEVSSAPVAVGSLTGVNRIEGGGYHFCAIAGGGSLHCFGRDHNGQLGNDAAYSNSSVPVPVQGMSSGVTDVALGSSHTCAIQGSGTYCWGSNSYGEIAGAVSG